MKLTDFKVLAFDVYGTLIDWESGMVTALKPLAHRQAVCLAFFPSHFDTPFFSQTTVNHCKKIKVLFVGCPALRRGFMIGVCFKNIVARQVLTDLVRQWFESCDHAAFPVDQRAINVEC